MLHAKSAFICVHLWLVIVKGPEKLKRLMLYSGEVSMGRMNLIFALFFDDDNITSKKVLPYYIHDIMNFQN